MLIAPPIHLSTRAQSESSLWELALRYAAATLATLLAIAGAQLLVPNSFIWMATVLTLVGVPVSIFLRLNDMKVGRVQIPRPLWNSLTVLSTFGTATYFVFWSMRDFLLPILTRQAPPSFWASFGPSQPVQLLMQVFLLFAAFRSFAIISDKDATLTTVPSFSVLLLLIPLHHSIEVVLYFIAWIFVAAMLFALDHRSEVRVGVGATVPAIVPGQDARLGARSLATVLGFSLFAAVGISFFLSSRDPDDRSSTETAISSLVARLTRAVLDTSESTINSGPERQIDFTAGPPLPSRAVLWEVSARQIGGKAIYPTYWRLFALSTYNGKGWSQRNGGLVPVPRRNLNFRRWPSSYSFYPPESRNQAGFGFSLDQQFPGYDVGRTVPQVARQFGSPTTLVRQTLIAHVSNIGFIPVQPGLRALVLQDSDQKEVRARQDGALDAGVVEEGQIVKVQSDVPALPEYGIARRAVPTKRFGAAQISAARVELSPAERRMNLQLVPTLPPRVGNWGRAMLKGVAPDASNYARAQRLALAIGEGAVYTLRPPAIPKERDATDYFLFDGARRGYCTYFAGALTVLCRTQGIPARVVSGFAGTQWQGPETGLLREANAHAWTEVWVDGFGWAIVDATPADDRGDNAPHWIQNWGDWLTSTFTNGMLWIRDHPVLPILAALTILAVFLGVKGHKHGLGAWFSRAENHDDLERRAVNETYRRTALAIARRFRPKSHWETPDEWLQACAATLSRPDAEELRRLTSLHLAARYGQHPLPAGTAKLAREIAARIGWKRIKRT